MPIGEGWVVCHLKLYGHVAIAACIKGHLLFYSLNNILTFPAQTQYSLPSIDHLLLIVITVNTLPFPLDIVVYNPFFIARYYIFKPRLVTMLRYSLQLVPQKRIYI